MLFIFLVLAYGLWRLQVMQSDKYSLLAEQNRVRNVPILAPRGTGVVASALVAAFKGFVKSPVSVRTRGGETLTVHFEIGDGEVKKVFFEGDVHIIYEAEMWEEACE